MLVFYVIESDTMERPDSGVPLFEMFVLILVQIVQIGGGSGTTAQKAIYTYKT